MASPSEIIFTVGKTKQPVVLKHIRELGSIYPSEFSGILKSAPDFNFAEQEYVRVSVQDRIAKMTGLLPKLDTSTTYAVDEYRVSIPKGVSINEFDLLNQLKDSIFVWPGYMGPAMVGNSLEILNNLETGAKYIALAGQKYLPTLRSNLFRLFIERNTGSKFSIEAQPLSEPLTNTHRILMFRDLADGDLPF